MRFESWAKNMKEELDSIGLVYIWHSQQEWDTSRLRRIIREICNDIERQKLSSIMSEKMPSVFYQEMNQKWGRGQYIELCCRNERNRSAWMKAAVWKIRGIRRGWEKVTCPLYRGNEDAKLILLICPETKKWTIQFIDKKWLCVNEELACKKIVNCTNKALIIHLG
jgi:hypothetical protein